MLNYFVRPLFFHFNVKLLFMSWNIKVLEIQFSNFHACLICIYEYFD